MDRIFTDFSRAQEYGSGALLSRTLLPFADAQDPDRLVAFYTGTNKFNVTSDIHSQILYNPYAGYRVSKSEAEAWVEVYVAYWRAIGEILVAEDAIAKGNNQDNDAAAADWGAVYGLWKDMSNALIRGYTTGQFQAWTVPCLYVAGRYLRIFAIKADEQIARMGGDQMNYDSGYGDDVMANLGNNEKLEDAARVINRIFTLCISDRAPLEESRKWGIYYTTNLLFKTYFRLNSISLSKNIIRALTASQTDMPPLEGFPKSHIVTFKYYVGVIHFLEEEYVKAEEHLLSALELCHRSALKNRELILMYLIPAHLITSRTLPSSALLAPYPHLQTLFGPISACIKRGDLAGFDAALTAGEDEFVKRRIYLTLERGRDIALRNLFRKVFLVSGSHEPSKEGEESTRRTRIPVNEFAAAMKLAGGAADDLEDDEVECLLANLIYKNFMKGYISRERSMVVLSKGGVAFPGTGV
ncbi:MAG: COP9 signalosome (CSN) subunit [Peltula sp. TS41687]|nr:MAG: COP9 signalosome (CSN) subunit [Peltula sp. TS41687]